MVPPGWVGNDAFLAGCSAPQAVPGPLFAITAYLGAARPNPLGGWAGCLALLAVILLPDFQFVGAAVPFWEAQQLRDGVQRATGGIDAGVVGVPKAALHDPVWISAIQFRAGFGLTRAAFGLLVFAQMALVLLVALAEATGRAIAG